ncbi:hypothetical protein ACIHCQ_32360 [Streptomyces sp. NPDC052236]|uniref:hypothetical protein n=1 Tax=Streptomyces sp. NPDC052236 TaxID=3365686 RepID=UPI0037CECC57
MSTELGKLVIDGIAHLPDGPAFALRVLQARDSDLVGAIAHARYDPAAQWWSELIPYGPYDQRLIPHQPLALEALLPQGEGITGGRGHPGGRNPGPSNPPHSHEREV